MNKWILKKGGRLCCKEWSTLWKKICKNRDLVRKMAAKKKKQKKTVKRECVNERTLYIQNKEVQTGKWRQLKKKKKKEKKKKECEWGKSKIWEERKRVSRESDLFTKERKWNVNNGERCEENW